MNDVQIGEKIIFVVDDDQDVQVFVKTILERSGLKVEQFLNGNELLNRIKDQIPDLILLDIDMPYGLDGFDVCRKLKADKQSDEIPIVFLSAAADVVNKVKGFELGAVDYIPKPVLPGELTARVKTHLANFQLKKELKKSEAKYRLMMESIIDPLYIVSPDYIVEYMNPAMVRQFGEKKVGQKCYLALHGLENPCKWCMVEKAQKDRSQAIEFVAPKNRRRYQVTTMPIHHDSGRVSPMNMMRDVTDYWNALEEKRKAEKRLLQAQKLESIGQLAAGIAHEINTPVQFIQDNTSFIETAFSELMPVLTLCEKVVDKIKSGSDTGELIEKMETALENADLEYHKEEIPLAIQQSYDGARRIAKIVQSMKEFSSREAGNVEIDINHTLENILTISKNEWKYVSNMCHDFDASLPKILCSPSELNQALLNIIINAANAIEEKLGPKPEKKGMIHITTSQVKNWIEIQIKDTGIGISEENMDRIFDPFFSTREIGRGSGQGLSVAYANIVEKNNGTIDCKSIPGQGTIFNIRLPSVQKKQDIEMGRSE